MLNKIFANFNRYAVKGISWLTFGQFAIAPWVGQLIFVVLVIVGTSFLFKKEERKGWSISVSLLAIVEMLSLLFA